MVETHIKHKKKLISVLGCAPLFPRNSSCRSASNKCTTKADTWLRPAARRGGVEWPLTHYSRLPSAPYHEGAGRPQERDQHEGLGASQRAGGGVKTRGCQVKNQAVQHTATNAVSRRDVELQEAEAPRPAQPQGEEGYERCEQSTGRRCPATGTAGS